MQHKSRHQSSFGAALVVAACLLGTLPAGAQPLTDPSYFGTGGPELTNATRPAPAGAFGGDRAPARPDAAPKMAASAATVGIEATLYNTAPPGQMAALNPQGVPATGFGSTVRDPLPPNYTASQPVDGAFYNTAAPGALAGLNPTLRPGTRPAARYAGAPLGFPAR